MAKVRIESGGVVIDRYLACDTDRHGNKRYYVRLKGRPKIRIRSEPGTRAFLEEYRRACNGDHQVQGESMVRRAQGQSARATAPEGSLGWLFNEYERRAESFRALGETTKQRRRIVMDQICAEPISETDPRPIGHLPFRPMRPRAVALICARAPTPDTANARMKALRGALAFAIAEDWITTNPAREVAYKARNTGGFHTWTVEQVQQFWRHHPIGTMPRLALDMLLFSGQRRSDVVRIGKQHCQGGGWQFTQFKGRNKSPVKLWIPILPVLQRTIDATPSRGLTYLETKFGKPFSSKGFGNRMKAWCKKAGLPPECTAHGLRKAGATIAAENGATVHQLMAIFGWRKISQAEIYTRMAEQKRLAAEGMHLLIPAESVPPSAGSAKWDKSAR